MAGSQPKSRDFGAAFAGLVLGGSVLFLVMLAIVWLTNSHFDRLRASGEHGAAPAPATQAAPTPGAPAPGAPAQTATPPAAPATH
jgi:hypothetical protein